MFLAKIEECTNATEIVKSVIELHALRWVAEGWKHVKSDTIQKCFVKGGILDRTGEVVSSPVSDGEDLFADLDIEDAGQADLETLISDVHGSRYMCSVADFISGNHDLPICQKFDEDWEQDDDGEGGDDELVCLERHQIFQQFNKLFYH